jgi:uncharacterized protein YdaU (DUF1376 family)
MNYYQYHIGDFNNATRHLTRLERSIYRDLLDLYYDTEKPLISDIKRLARLCLIDSDSMDALDSVLSEFFTASDDGYSNKRADAEIEAYKKQVEGGKLGNAKRWGKRDRVALESPPESVATRNHEPVTSNHEPVTSDGTAKPRRASLFDGKTEIPEAWGNWLKNVRPELVPEAVYFKFRAHYAESGSKRVDWFGAWQIWAINERIEKSTKLDVERQTVPSKSGEDPALTKIKADRLKSRPPTLAELAAMAKARAKPKGGKNDH